MERATISRQQQTQRAFLGAALMDPARAREYIIKLVPGMFDEGVSRAVFSALQQLTMAGEPVDVITVINRASAGRPADEIRPGVVAMAETCPSVSNIGSYAAQILEDYRYSLLQGDLMKCMAKDAMDSDGVCRQLRRTLAVQDAIRSTQTDSTARDFDAVLDSALARLDEPNPENSIYEIGDVSMLKADIAERGLRSPLEVLHAKGGRYMLIAGHRRWTACRALTAEGVAGFEVLPCVIRQSQGEDDDLIALITSNATARELTDGERLRQYRALKQALERKKAAGALDGRIRDEMSRITGDGTGTLGRLNAIANNCVPDVLAMLERGEITMTRAYECSKLYKVQQVEYAKNKYASMPPITDMARRAAIKYLVECGLADQLKKLDYVRKSEWNYADRGLDVRKMEPVTLDLTESETDALLRIEPDDYRGVRVQMRDPADTDEVLAESLLYPRDFFDAAKRLYINRDDLAAYKAEVKGRRDQERARQEEAGKWQALARQELEAFDSWPLVTRLKDLGLTIRERKMADGGRLIIAVDDLARFSGHVDGFQYREFFAVRLGPNGERAGRDGDINALEWHKRWYSTGAGIENYIAEDIERSEKK